MSWKRGCLEGAVWTAARCVGTHRTLPSSPRALFVLRNNDLGDVLVVTPLFAALRQRFPEARIVAGVGAWAAPLLEGNPHITEVLPFNAPWHNQVVPRQGVWAALRYICLSREARSLARGRFDLGIDVLGSPWGALLLLRGGIPYRLGMQGYAGGHSAMQQCVAFRHYVHVGRSALGFAELLGATELPKTRPQIFLRHAELAAAEHRWNDLGLPPRVSTMRIVVGPGGGFPEKCWPLGYWRELVQLLSDEIRCAILVVGGAQDEAAGDQLAASHPLVRSLAGRATLRETAAMVAQADVVLCHSSFLMHVAAALQKPAVVLLGPWFPSARFQMAQWGHGPGTLMLGKDGGRTRIYTPIEVFAALEEAFHLEVAA